MTSHWTGKNSIIIAMVMSMFIAMVGPAASHSDHDHAEDFGETGPMTIEHASARHLDDKLVVELLLKNEQNEGLDFEKIMMNGSIIINEDTVTKPHIASGEMLDFTGENAINLPKMYNGSRFLSISLHFKGTEPNLITLVVD